MSCKSGAVPVRMPDEVLVREQGQTLGSPAFSHNTDLGCKPSLSGKAKALDEGLGGCCMESLGCLLSPEDLPSSQRNK